ncbi:hypothetical protein RUND412_000740 [Rhizina undulata]
MPRAVETGKTTRQHVDELILDYLLWFGVESLPLERKLRMEGHVGAREWLEASKAADMGLRMVNSCTNLRIHLYRFTSLFLRRLDATTPALAPPPPELSAARTKQWLERRGISNVFSSLEPSLPSTPPVDVSSTPFPEEHLYRNHGELLQHIGYTPIQASQVSIWGNAALKEILREFMVLSTWTTAYFAEASSLWMQTAVSFMLQAALETYRCQGAENIDALNEYFSWGLAKSPDISNDHIEDIVINEIFVGNSGQVSLEFEMLKHGMLREIIPPAGTTLESHFDNLAAKYPWQKFEENLVLGFLGAVTQSVSKPVLAQLEQGRLEGFGDKEVSELLSVAGIGR